MADIEAAKRTAATRAVKDHFPSSAKFVGIGSGSTIVYVVNAIKALNIDISGIKFIPTGSQSRELITKAGFTVATFDTLPEDEMIEVVFDGADEVDEDLNLIKGGGACLYQEKLVATHAKKFVCVADHRKLQSRLLTKWPTIPIEVEPLAAPSVLFALRSLGSTAPIIRQGPSGKAGPLKTDQSNFIIDAPFSTLLLPTDVEKSQSLHPVQKGYSGRGGDGKWEVESLAKQIKQIEGVLSVGIFCGENGEEISAKGGRTGGQKPVVVYFGMADGGVEVRTKRNVVSKSENDGQST